MKRGCIHQIKGKEKPKSLLQMITKMVVLDRVHLRRSGGGGEREGRALWSTSSTSAPAGNFLTLNSPSLLDLDGLDIRARQSSPGFAAPRERSPS
jgi:hypothetical protein